MVVVHTCTVGGHGGLGCPVDVQMGFIRRQRVAARLPLFLPKPLTCNYHVTLDWLVSGRQTRRR